MYLTVVKPWRRVETDHFLHYENCCSCLTTTDWNIFKLNCTIISNSIKILCQILPKQKVFYQPLKNALWLCMFNPFIPKICCLQYCLQVWSICTIFFFKWKKTDIVPLYIARCILTQLTYCSFPVNILLSSCCHTLPFVTLKSYYYMLLLHMCMHTHIVMLYC